ncbi:MULTISPECIES: tetratricopeptide repeat protein [Reichenbachiella]|uniref:Tetratricopeptide repeat-containing protein n=1 Tax=Reichenbachiella agariperforans TaxID=156994 RepID=A0A1M6K9Q8_REIAG|nr:MULTISPECIES: hypothetical protein [Reichenbachiella]MBU2913472.1 hypothetical protein [Reichenbachiella agariperforans]RJE74558.1 hypothetical protein BGP76_15555 [Reichenbachiella sp. MSK19-1]SHJ55640.1 hypothetical protein SAMN04488028_101492 [Reichenbachiella agariperforans]
MKRYIAILTLALFAGISIHANAQEKTEQPKDSLTYADMQMRKYYSIYQLANQFNDPNVARMALYEMLMLTANQPAILDSLAINYYSMNQFASAALVSQENLKINPDNQTALEIAALSFQNLGVMTKALDNYETLFLKNNNTNTLYQMAFLQFQLKRFKESKTSTELLLQRKDVDEIKLRFNKVDKTQQEVSMRAAVLNLQGLIAKETGDNEKAKQLYLDALNAAPGFELAQVNLRELKKPVGE